MNISNDKILTKKWNAFEISINIGYLQKDVWKKRMLLQKNYLLTVAKSICAEYELVV